MRVHVLGFERFCDPGLAAGGLKPNYHFPAIGNRVGDALVFDDLVVHPFEIKCSIMNYCIRTGNATSKSVSPVASGLEASLSGSCLSRMFNRPTETVPVVHTV